MKLFFSLLITLGAGAFAGLATASAIDDWYARLTKPVFNPPNALFGPVWTVLYILMGIALAKVWKYPPSPLRSRAMAMFFLQLSLNFCWSFLFFWFHRTGLALVDISLLLAAIVVTLFLFAPFGKSAAALLVPYLLWVGFATVLNACIYVLNP